MIKAPYITIFLLLSCMSANAQDLEPRLLAMMPVKTNFAVASYAYSHGNVLVDNTLPIENLNAALNIIGAGYARSFNLFGKLAKIDAVIPYSFGNWDAIVAQNDTITSRNGFADPIFRISMILIGGPALTPAEYPAYQLKKFRLGAQFRFRPPLGQYDPEQFINLGLNRWAFKLGIGASYRIKKLTLEAQFNTWFFTANNNFFGGNKLEQHPLVSFQVHGVYIFKKGMWVSGSFGAGFFGGISYNDDIFQNNQNNMRFGLAFAFPVAKGHGFQIAYTNGASTRYGSDFNSVLLIYHFMWFDKK